MNKANVQQQKVKTLQNKNTSLKVFLKEKSKLNITKTKVTILSSFSAWIISLMIIKV